MEGKTNYCLCPSHKEMLSKMSLDELNKMYALELETYACYENLISLSEKLFPMFIKELKNGAAITGLSLPGGDGNAISKEEYESNMKELKRSNINRKALMEFILEELKSRGTIFYE